MESCQTAGESSFQYARINIRNNNPDCTLECARQLAVNEAEKADNAPKLLSWYARKEQEFSPEGECVNGKPGWLTYATANNANLTVDVNDGEYIFMFRKSHGLP